MGIQIKQLADGSLGLEGRDLDDGAFEFVQINYTASIASTSIFTAPRACIVKAIRGRVDVAGTGGACTLAFRKAPSGTAGGSGTLLHSGTYNIVGTANASQSLTLSTTPSDLLLAAGDSIYVVLSGTPTSAVGNITVALCPA